MNSSSGPKTIQSVEVSFSIIETLRESQPITVSEVSTATSLPISTAYVHLDTLRQAGYVIKDGASYRLSFRFLELGDSTRQQLNYFTTVKRAVNDLATITGEISGFAVEEQGLRVILYRGGEGNPKDRRIPIGEYTYLHWTSLGNAILAHMPEHRIEEIVDRHGLPEGTSKTTTDLDRLREELEIIRSTGYAVDDEARHRGVRGIAVPLLDAEAQPLGSIGIVGPQARFDEHYLGEIVEVLFEKRDEIRSSLESKRVI